MSAPSLGLAVIACDEERNLPHLLASVEGSFDQVALLDTGSADRTVEVFTEWAEEQTLPLGHRLGHFDWRDDFSAARNAADALLDTDWLCWADADDQIEGAPLLRDFVAAAQPHYSAVAFRYGYFPDAPAEADLIYTRLTRRGACRWAGRVHEGINFTEGVRLACDRPLPRWVHRCPSLAAHRERNFRILRAWVADEPGNPMPLALLAHEHLLDGDRPQLVEHARTYLERFGDRMKPAERAAAHWAVEGIAIGADAIHRELLGNTEALVRIALGPVTHLQNQAAPGPRPLATVLPGGDAMCG